MLQALPGSSGVSFPKGSEEPIVCRGVYLCRSVYYIGIFRNIGECTVYMLGVHLVGEGPEIRNPWVV